MESRDTYIHNSSVIRESERADGSRYHTGYTYTPEDGDLVTVCGSVREAAGRLLESPFDGTAEFFSGRFPKACLPAAADRDRDYLFVGRKDGGERRFFLYPETI